ncbi:MAG: short-chain dehydrogenase, partial [Cohnella sp.]|nr:short-chain dehydrogenase [Cohnella sp.]
QDMGGPQAPNAVESVVPGIAVGAFVDDRKSGRFLPAQAFAGMTLEEAVAKAESFEANPYAI